MFYALENTQELLTNLRNQVETIGSNHPSSLTSDPFYGNMLCHLDVEKSRYCDLEYSLTKQIIYIERSNTVLAASIDHPHTTVLPALDCFQMDKFASDRCPQDLIDQLPSSDVSLKVISREASSRLKSQQRKIISNAWKYAYWINVLFNWDQHQIFTDQYTSLGIEHPVNLQSLVIEFMYSITYLVKRLMDSLWKNVIASFGQTSTAKHDSWTVSYAILIVCYAIKGSKNLKCDAKGLPYLVLFFLISRIKSCADTDNRKSSCLACVLPQNRC